MSVIDSSAHAERTWSTGYDHAEQLLLDEFMRQTKLSRSPVLAYDGRSVHITNRAASLLLRRLDQSVILDRALDPTETDETLGSPMTLSDGTEVTISRVWPGGRADTSIGVVVTVRRLASITPLSTVDPRHHTVAPELPGVAPRWRQMAERIAAAGRAPIVLYGERGSGKLTIARTILPPEPVTILDAEKVLCSGPAKWLRDLHDFVEQPSGSLILAHIEHLDTTLVRTGTRILQPVKGIRRIIATATTNRGESLPEPLNERADVLVAVPPLRERTEDLPALLRELTLRHVGEDRTPPRWMADAVQALRRLDWPGNVRQLDGTVSDVLKRTGMPYIGRMDLPADMLAQTSRRNRTAIERLEAEALTKALREAGGNKFEAANALGIARSTLYRWMRAHGIEG